MIMKYDQRIVLFLDILGFKKIVLETIEKQETNGNFIDRKEKILDLHNTLSKMGEIAGNQSILNNINVTQFSDSIVISFLEESPNNAPKVFRIILEIIINLIKRGIICRGAISYGKFIHSEKILFGPALIDAYETESKAAMYPRVIMDKRIYDYSNSSKIKLSKVKDNPISGYIKEDLDGKFYIDYISNAHLIIQDEYELIEFYKSLRNIIVKGRRYDQPDLKVKYGWLKSKYDSFLNSDITKKTKSIILEDYFRQLKPLK